MRTRLLFEVMTNFSLVFMQNRFSSVLKVLRGGRVYNRDFSDHFLFQIETSNIQHQIEAIHYLKQPRFHV